MANTEHGHGQDLKHQLYNSCINIQLYDITTERGSKRNRYSPFHIRQNESDESLEPTNEVPTEDRGRTMHQGYRTQT